MNWSQKLFRPVGRAKNHPIVLRYTCKSSIPTKAYYHTLHGGIKKSCYRTLHNHSRKPTHVSFYYIFTRFVAISAASSSHYDILGLQRGASKQEIRNAYIQKTKQYHPDSNPGDESLHSKFQEVSEAYSVLSDERERTTYDQTNSGKPSKQNFTGYDYTKYTSQTNTAPRETRQKRDVDYDSWRMGEYENGFYSYSSYDDEEDDEYDDWSDDFSGHRSRKKRPNWEDGIYVEKDSRRGKAKNKKHAAERQKAAANQHKLRKNIEIWGMPRDIRQNDLYYAVNKILKSIDVKERGGIEDCYRIPVKKHSKFPGKVRVCFVNEELANEVLMNRRKLRQKTGKNSKLFIIEELCTAYRLIYEAANQLCKDEIISNFWTVKGVVHVRVNHYDKKVLTFTHMDDMEAKFMHHYYDNNDYDD